MRTNFKRANVLLLLYFILGAIALNGQGYSVEMINPQELQKHSFFEMSEASESGDYYVLRYDFNLFDEDAFVLEEYSNNEKSESIPLHVSREDGHSILFKKVFVKDEHVVVIHTETVKGKSKLISQLYDRKNLKESPISRTLMEYSQAKPSEYGGYSDVIVSGASNSVGVFINLPYSGKETRSIEYQILGLDLELQWKGTMNIPLEAEGSQLVEIHLDNQGNPVWLVSKYNEEWKDYTTNFLNDTKAYVYRASESETEQSPTVIAIEGKKIDHISLLNTRMGLKAAGIYTNYYWAGQGRAKSGKRQSGAFLVDLDSNRGETISPILAPYGPNDFSLRPDVRSKLEKKLEKNWFIGRADLTQFGLEELSDESVVVLSESRWEEEGNEVAGALVITRFDSSGKEIWTTCVEKIQEPNKNYHTSKCVMVEGEKDIFLFYNEHPKNLVPEVIPSEEKRKRQKGVNNSLIGCARISKDNGSQEISPMNSGPGKGWFLRENISEQSQLNEIVVFIRSSDQESFMTIKSQ